MAGSKKWSLERLGEIEKESKATLDGVANSESEPAAKRKRVEDGGKTILYKLVPIYGSR